MIHAGAIDVHYHIGPPRWTQWLESQGQLSGLWRNWSLERALEAMDRDGVGLSMTSITTPGTWFGDSKAAREVARSCNEFAAKLAVDHPGRFGTFATLPLPDVDGAMQEIEYAFDQLHADGVAVFTSYGDKWLGDDFLRPVFEELNRRKAVVFVHPTLPACCSTILPFLLPSVVEYGKGHHAHDCELDFHWHDKALCGHTVYFFTRRRNNAVSYRALCEPAPCT